MRTIQGCSWCRRCSLCCCNRWKRPLHDPVIGNLLPAPSHCLLSLWLLSCLLPLYPLTCFNLLVLWCLSLSPPLHLNFLLSSFLHLYTFYFLLPSFVTSEFVKMKGLVFAKLAQNHKSGKHKTSLFRTCGNMRYDASLGKNSTNLRWTHSPSAVFIMFNACVRERKVEKLRRARN